MLKGPNDNVAWATALALPQSRLLHSSWATLLDHTHAARLQEMPGEAFQLTPKKSEYTHPHHESKHQLDHHASSWVKSPTGTVTPWWCSGIYPSALLLTCTCAPRHGTNWSGSTPWAMCNAWEIIYLQRKHTESKGNPPIFCHTFHSGHCLDSAATLLHKTLRTETSATSAHKFSFSTSHVLYCENLVLLYMYT